MALNPIIRMDYPDPDVIRVDDTYYMVSTTMYYMPGAVILRSYNLVDWEIASYLYDTLEDTPQENLEGTAHAYGKGMWAASIRYHKGTYYVCFVANDTHKTYLYQSESITGPWRKQNIEGFYHDNSILFDDDGRTYIVYGNRQIFITELTEDLTGPKEGGLNQLLLTDDDSYSLGFEGTHFYKIGGKYYLFFIHWPRGGRRTQACYVADRPEGPYTGGNVLDDDMGYHDQGVAQGGIVQDPDGNWYAILFRDTGAVGRIPVLMPVTFVDDFPVFGDHGKIPETFPIKDLNPGYQYAPLYGDDDFSYQPGEPLKNFWQWNHNPDPDAWSLEAASSLEKFSSPPLVSDTKRDAKTVSDTLVLTLNKICQNPVYAKNTLTQRMHFPETAASVTIDASGLKDGDFAGFCALQSCYGAIGIKKEQGQNYLVMIARTTEPGSPLVLPEAPGPAEEFARIPLVSDTVRVRVSGDFRDMKDTMAFYYEEDGSWKKLGIDLKGYFKLDHFTGYRYALCGYATRETGGKARFRKFVYEK